jgi:hypothetical protein
MSVKPLPASFIDPKLAKTRVMNYKSGSYTTLSEKLSSANNEDVSETKSVWYSATQLQDWIDEIKRYGGDGIRIYLGQKEDLNPGEKYDERTGEPRPGQLCLVIIPTKAGSNTSIHENLIYDKLDDYQERLDATPPRPKEMAFNLGGYCPPWCLTEGEDLFD